MRPQFHILHSVLGYYLDQIYYSNCSSHESSKNASEMFSDSSDSKRVYPVRVEIVHLISHVKNSQLSGRSQSLTRCQLTYQL